MPAGHPLRTIKGLADRALAQLSPEFDRMYAQIGRPSIPPERLLKASLLISLYSVRSERGFCEQLDYNLLFRWFLGMNLMEPSFDPTVFTKPESTGTGMDGVRTAEGGEGVTGAMIRARIWVDGRLAGGLQALHRRPKWLRARWRDRTRQEALARAGASLQGRVGWRVSGDGQAGSGMARSRARARLNCSSQGQRRGRCSNRRAERVIRPAKAKTRQGLGGHASADPGRCGLSSGPGCAPSPVPPARRRWRRSGPRGDGSAPRRT